MTSFKSTQSTPLKPHRRLPLALELGYPDTSGVTQAWRRSLQEDRGSKQVLDYKSWSARVLNLVFAWILLLRLVRIWDAGN